MSDFWRVMKDCMEEDPIITMFILLLIAGCIVSWIAFCIVYPSLILFTVAIFAITFGLWKFCEWMVSKSVKNDNHNKRN